MLRHYATSRKVAGSNPNEVIRFYIWLNPPSRTMTLSSIQSLTEMSSRNFPGGKERPLSVSRLSRECENLDASEPSGSPRPVTEIALCFSNNRFFPNPYQFTVHYHPSSSRLVWIPASIDMWLLNKLRGFSPQANYTDWATAACRRNQCQLLRIESISWSAQRIPTAVNLNFLDSEPLLFHSSSSSAIGRQNGTEACFLRLLRFLLSILIPPIAAQSSSSSSSIIQSWYNKPINWPKYQVDPVSPHNKKKKKDYTDCRAPWTGDQPVARQLPTQTHNKRTETSVSQVGFEPTFPAFAQTKTVHRPLW
jgi:hypothetical protein